MRPGPNRAADSAASINSMHQGMKGMSLRVAPMDSPSETEAGKEGPSDKGKVFDSLAPDEDEAGALDMANSGPFASLTVAGKEAGETLSPADSDSDLDSMFTASESSVSLMTEISGDDSMRQGAARRRWRRLKWVLQFGAITRSLAEPSGMSALSWFVKRELLHNFPAANLQHLGALLTSLCTMPRALSKEAVDSMVNGWRDPGGANFNVRGKNYLADRVKIPGGEPLLKLVAMDWFTDSQRMDHIAGRPGCLVQSRPGQAVPFFFVLNLQVPGPPHYSLVTYFIADRPVRPQGKSLLYRFWTNKDDEFRNRRFKLIPRIMSEGYWMVRAAVGNKPSILGKALKCTWWRGRNYLEMDCDIGSSSVARNIIGLVFSYLVTLVVDFAIIIEAQETEDLPEYLLSTFTCIRMDVKQAVAPPPASAS